MQIEQFKGPISELSTMYPSNLEIISLDISRFYKVQRSFAKETERGGRIMKNSTRL